MKMRKKTLTIECNGCEYRRMETTCGWGNSKVAKVLTPPLGNAKHCRLIYDGMEKIILSRKEEKKEEINEREIDGQTSNN